MMRGPSPRWGPGEAVPYRQATRGRYTVGSRGVFGASAHSPRGADARTEPRQRAAEGVVEAKRRLGVSWAEIAEAADADPVWLTTALLGQARLERPAAEAVARRLELPEATVEDLLAPPDRTGATLDPSDPMIYRLFEMVQVHGTALRELLYEQVGDGIISAIDFQLGMETREVDGATRVVLTLDGKFLPYRTW